MSKELFDYDFQVDLTEKDETYPMDDVQWIYINDINQNNYSSGFINWTNVAVVGSNVNKQYSWANAYLSIPYMVSVVADGTNCILADSAANCNALSVKNYLHLVDWASIKFNGVQCNRGSYYLNFYNNEQMKQMNTDEYKLYSDILCHAWDNPNGLHLNAAATVGESNNILNDLNFAVEDGLLPNTITNDGHLKRCKITNTDLHNAVNNTMSNYFGTNAFQVLNNEQQSGLVYQGAGGLVYQGYANIPLAKLHPFFADMPTVASSSGFELRLQMNIARENSWKVTYAAANTAGIAMPNGITVNQVVGHTCPFMLANPILCNCNW
jgi:hypothetical protein